MADSLRDQLIAAGFEAPKKKPANKSGKGKAGKSNAGNNKSRSKKRPDQRKHAGAANKKAAAKGSANSAEAEQQALERKKLKAQIKDLIDNNQLKEWKGEVTYRYLVDKRIRELYVNEAVHKQLAAREVAITRLNGETFLVPLAIATEIKQVNPQWSVFNTESDTESTKKGDEDYAEFQVPDDLQW